MSHFPLAGAVFLLAAGVIESAEEALLVTPSGAADGVLPGEEGAAIEAVDVAAVATPADQHLLATAGTAVEAMGGRGRWLFWHAGVDNSGASPENAGCRRFAVGFRSPVSCDNSRGLLLFVWGRCTRGVLGFSSGRGEPPASVMGRAGGAGSAGYDSQELVGRVRSGVIAQTGITTRFFTGTDTTQGPNQTPGAQPQLYAGK